MEFLNYHHLRYFWVVAKEGGLRKAADKLHVSQPTISAQIAALEGVLEEKLFRRGGPSYPNSRPPFSKAASTPKTRAETC